MELFIVLVVIAGGVLGREERRGTTEIIDLNGDDWWLQGQDGSRYRAKVPGQVHLDLLASGVIGNPYYGWEVDNQRWVAEAEWTYEREFELTD